MTGPKLKKSAIFNGQPIYSQPYGDNETSYQGGETVEKKALVYKNGEPPAYTYYGSNREDTIVALENEIHPILFGGNGNDTLRLSSTHHTSYPYLAGNDGVNQYHVSSKAGHVFINDKNGQGKITIDDHYDLCGIAIATDTTKQAFNLFVKDKKYKLNLVPNNTNTPSLHISWDDPNNDITLSHFKSGQLNLILAHEYATIFEDNCIIPPHRLPSGNVVFISTFPPDDGTIKGGQCCVGHFR